MVASASNATPLPPLYADKPGQSGQDESASARTHVVKSGESLWQIAHRYAVSVSTLERINHLRGKALKPGQVLKLDAKQP
jgi:membrane-bound lytic murein transglycosylase D